MDNSPAAPKLGLLVADARVLLKNCPWKYFDQAVQFDPKDENKILPTNDVFLKRGVFTKGKQGVHWDVCTKAEDGEDQRVVMGGPLCMSSSLFVNKLGNFGLNMANAPTDESKAGYWFEISGQSYYEPNEPNEHVQEFYSWWKRMALWGFKTALEDTKFTIAWKDRLKDHETFEKKTPKDWTPAEWHTKCFDVAKFAPIRRDKESDQLAAGIEGKMFFEKAGQTGDKRKNVASAPIPEIAAVEEKYGVSYNDLPVYRFASNGQMLPLSAKEKWDGSLFKRSTVYWPFFTTQFSDNGSGVVNLKLRLNKLVVVGQALCPLPESFGPRPISFQVDTEDPAYKDFIRKQAEEEARKAFAESAE